MTRHIMYVTEKERAARREYLMRLASQGSGHKSASEKLRMLEAREMLKYMPVAGEFAGPRPDIAAEIGVSRNYVDITLFPDDESRIFSTPAPEDGGSAKYWRVWELLLDHVSGKARARVPYDPAQGTGDPPGSPGTGKTNTRKAKEWRRLKEHIDHIALAMRVGRTVRYNRPGSRSVDMLRSRLDALGVRYTLNRYNGWPHDYTFSPPGRPAQKERAREEAMAV